MAHLFLMFSCANHYISPNFYPQEKVNNKALPTWNYCVINAFVEPSFLAPDELKNHLSMMTEHNEKNQNIPWQLSDAPEDYAHMLMNHIQGIRLKVTRLEGIFKLSQDKKAPEFQGVINGLEHMNNTSAKNIARYMKKMR